MIRLRPNKLYSSFYFKLILNPVAKIKKLLEKHIQNHCPARYLATGLQEWRCVN